MKYCFTFSISSTALSVTEILVLAILIQAKPACFMLSVLPCMCSLGGLACENGHPCVVYVSGIPTFKVFITSMGWNGGATGEESPYFVLISPSNSRVPLFCFLFFAFCLFFSSPLVH